MLDWKLKSNVQEKFRKYRTFKISDSPEISFLLFNLNIRSNIYLDILSKSLYFETM